MIDLNKGKIFDLDLGPVSWEQAAERPPPKIKYL